MEPILHYQDTIIGIFRLHIDSGKVTDISDGNGINCYWSMKWI